MTVGTGKMADTKFAVNDFEAIAAGLNELERKMAEAIVNTGDWSDLATIATDVAKSLEYVGYGEFSIDAVKLTAIRPYFFSWVNGCMKASTIEGDG